MSGLRVPKLAPVNREAGAKSARSQATPPLHNVQKHFRAETAVWNRIRAAELGESAIGKLTAGSGLLSSVPAVVRADDYLGFVPSQTGLRELAAALPRASMAPQILPAAREPAAREKVRGSDPNPGAPLLPVPSTGSVPRVPSQVSTLFLKKTDFSDLVRSAKGRHLGRFWQPAAIAVALLVLAVVLLAGRASVLPSNDQVAATDHAPQASDRPVTSSPPPDLPEVRPHNSGGDFVAEDYTTRFDLQGNRRTTLRTPDLRPEAQNRPIPKRIVVN